MALYTVYTKDAAQVVASEADSIGKKLTGFLTAPIGFSDTELVTKTTQSVNVAGWAVVSGLVMELIGHRRAAQGKQAFLPFGRP